MQVSGPHSVRDVLLASLGYMAPAELGGTGGCRAHVLPKPGRVRVLPDDVATALSGISRCLATPVSVAARGERPAPLALKVLALLPGEFDLH